MADPRARKKADRAVDADHDIVYEQETDRVERLERFRRGPEPAAELYTAGAAELRALVARHFPERLGYRPVLRSNNVGDEVVEIRLGRAAFVCCCRRLQPRLMVTPEEPAGAQVVAAFDADYRLPALKRRLIWGSVAFGAFNLCCFLPVELRVMKDLSELGKLVALLPLASPFLILLAYDRIWRYIMLQRYEHRSTDEYHSQALADWASFRADFERHFADWTTTDEVQDG